MMATAIPSAFDSAAATDRQGRLSKVVPDLDAAVAGVEDGSTVLIGGFGGAGTPVELREALAARRPKDVTLVANNADFGNFVYPGGVRKVICSFPVGKTTPRLLDAVEAGEVELSI